MAYRNPPEERQFQPGQSGNPSGRPKGSLNLSSWIQKLLNDEEFEVLLSDKTKFKGAPIEAIVSTAITKAIEGDIKWAEWLARYGYGNHINIETSAKELPAPILGGISVKKYE